MDNASASGAEDCPFESGLVRPFFFLNANVGIKSKLVYSFGVKQALVLCLGSKQQQQQWRGQ